MSIGVGGTETSGTFERWLYPSEMNMCRIEV